MKTEMIFESWEDRYSDIEENDFDNYEQEHFISDEELDRMSENYKVKYVEGIRDTTPTSDITKLNFLSKNKPLKYEILKTSKLPPINIQNNCKILDNKLSLKTIMQKEKNTLRLIQEEEKLKKKLLEEKNAIKLIQEEENAKKKLLEEKNAIKLIQEEEKKKIVEKEERQKKKIFDEAQRKKDIQDGWITIDNNKPKLDRNKSFNILADKDKIKNKLKYSKLCLYIEKGEKCPYKNCNFAHDIKQLNIIDCIFGCNCKYIKNNNYTYTNLSKTTLCKFKHEKETLNNYSNRIGINKNFINVLTI